MLRKKIGKRCCRATAGEVREDFLGMAKVLTCVAQVKTGLG